MNWRSIIAAPLYWLGLALSLPGLGFVILSDLIHPKDDWSPLDEP